MVSKNDLKKLFLCIYIYVYIYFFNEGEWLLSLKKKKNTTAHFWCNDHTTIISVCEVWSVKIRVQVSRKKFYIHRHLD